MQIKTNRILGFINKTFSIKQNAVWKEGNYAELVAAATSHNTYLETINSETMPNADTFHYRISTDTDVSRLMHEFLTLTHKQLKKLKGRKAIVIVDYTCEPFFGKTQDDWIHSYRPANGSRGCYKFLAASIVMDEQRYFVYAKPVSILADETFELWQMLAHLQALGIKPKALLMDRGFSRDSENLALLHDLGINYLGLYPKYRNIKKIIGKMKRSFINRKFRVRGVETRLVIGKEEKITWVFVTNMEIADFVKYKALYKKRWNIETGFRVHDEARIKTKSIDVRVRYFLFLAGLLLYNAWKSLRITISFKRFVICAEWCVVRNVAKPT